MTYVEKKDFIVAVKMVTSEPPLHSRESCSLRVPKQIKMGEFRPCDAAEITGSHDHDIMQIHLAGLQAMHLWRSHDRTNERRLRK